MRDFRFGTLVAEEVRRVGNLYIYIIIYIDDYRCSAFYVPILIRTQRFPVSGIIEQMAHHQGYMCGLVVLSASDVELASLVCSGN